MRKAAGAQGSPTIVIAMIAAAISQPTAMARPPHRSHRMLRISAMAVPYAADCLRNNSFSRNTS